MKLYDFFEDLIDKFLKPSKRVKNILNNQRQKQKSKNQSLTNKIDHIIQTDDNLKLKPATYFSVMSKTLCLVLLFMLTFCGSYFIFRKDIQRFSKKQDSIMITKMKSVSDTLHIKPLSWGFESILQHFHSAKYEDCWKGRDLKIELRDYNNFMYIGEFYCIIFLCAGVTVIIFNLLWCISFYLFPKILNVLTCLLSIMYGFFWSVMIFLIIITAEYKRDIISRLKPIISHSDYPSFPSIFNFLPFTLFVLPFIITFITMFVAALLYQRKKNKFERFNEGFYRFTNYLIICLFFMNIIIHFYHLCSIDGFLLKIMIFISCLLYIAEFIYGVFLFLIALEQLEIYTQEKLPQKYEWFLINLFFWSFYRIFISILTLIVKIIQYIIEYIEYKLNISIIESLKDKK